MSGTWGAWSEKGAEIKGFAEAEKRREYTARKRRERIDKRPANFQSPGTGYRRLADRFDRRFRAALNGFRMFASKL